MALNEDTTCRFIKLGGYTTKTWVFWGEERMVPVTFAFEKEHRDATETRGQRMSRAVFDRLHALQGHTPVHVHTLGRRHWWWFRDAFYCTTEVFSDPFIVKERLLAKGSQSAVPPKSESRPPPSSGWQPREGQGPRAILGVGPHATFAEIRVAYRLRISEYHPDKVATLGAELRRVAEEMTKKINHAYAELKALHGELETDRGTPH